MKRSFYARYAWPIMIGLGGLFPVVVWGAREAIEHSNNNVYQWLAERSEETEDYEEFRRRFGTDDFALVSWNDCTLEDARLETFAHGCEHSKENSKWFKRVATGPRMLDTLMDEPFNLSREEALTRLEGTLVGPDHQTSCAVVTLSEAGDANRTAALEALEEIAEKDCQIDPNDLRLGGDAVINAAIDIESQRAIDKWIVWSWLIGTVVAWACLRNIRLMVMIFVVAGFSAALGTAIIHFTGGTMNLVLVVVPVLIYVLPLSAAVHLSNYYLDAVRESGPAGAPLRAMAAGWMPCTLSAVTTALGLISLRVSNILPVREFGIYSAVGIITSLVVLFALLPAALETWPPRGGSTPGRGGTSSGGMRERLIRRWADWLIRHRRPVVGICLALLVFFAGGVAFVRTTIAPSRFFSHKSKWVKDAAWLQEKLGPLVPIEVLIVFEGECSMTFLERMELVRQVEQTLQEDFIKNVGGTISAATFAPALDEGRGPSGPDSGIGRTGNAMLKVLGMGDPEAIRRRILNRRLLRHRRHFEKTNYLYRGPEEELELWRISARVEGFTDLEHDKFLYDEVKKRVDELLDKRVGSTGTVRAVCTGVVPLVYLSQRELLHGLYRSFCLAFGLIALVMLLLLRNLWAGLLVMLPNVFPAVVTFGTMGWTGKLVDIGAMMTASVALGIAVDDTLHFLTWFRRGLGQGQTRHQAIVEAYRRCAPAMTQTTLVAGLGLLVFALSSFQPVSQFGLLMFILLVAALVGDLVLLPAMLATRLGRYFEPNGRTGGNRPSPIRRANSGSAARSRPAVDDRPGG